jgi:two-component system, NtrC family, sensor histidine kinase HydH
MVIELKLVKNLILQPKSLILIFIVTAVIILSSVLIELNQSKAEMFELMEKQGHTLLETILTSSKNALLSYEKNEAAIKQRLLDNAIMIRMLYAKGLVSNKVLEEISSKNHIYRINIFNKSGEKIFSSHKEIHLQLPESNSPQQFLQQIFDGDEDTLIIGIKQARFGEGQRFAIALSSGNGGAIVLNVDADELSKFRKEVGFGVLLKKVTENQQIVYAALQDEKGIIAGAGKIQNLESIDTSDQLKNTLKNNTYTWHIAELGETQVFEALHPFIYNNETVGIFRVGISLEPLNKINERLTRRIIILGIVLFIFGFITITLIFVRQNFNLLSKKFQAVESYSEQILQNVSDGIIVMDSDLKIKSVNEAAEKLFGISAAAASGMAFHSLFLGTKCEYLLISESTIEEIECIIQDKQKILLVSKSEFEDENHSINKILVIRDLTEQKRLEKQIIRNERLTAMGELASSVAHEIRNPLNSIGTITQQLGKDFFPSENIDEYRSLTQLVYKEVKRINETIENFLKFAKPQPVKPENLLLNDLISQLEIQYREICRQKEIQLTISNFYQGNVIWDRQLITQVMINLIQNSIDALPPNGKLSIQSKEINPAQIEILISDTGKGIPPENMKRIFNLYFTTKKNGSGIGLSIVQRIISEHYGVISVRSEINQGTTFTIQLPKEIVKG